MNRHNAAVFALEYLVREARILYNGMSNERQLDWHELGTAIQRAEHVLRLERVAVSRVVQKYAGAELSAD